MFEDTRVSSEKIKFTSHAVRRRSKFDFLESNVAESLSLDKLSLKHWACGRSYYFTICKRILRFHKE